VCRILSFANPALEFHGSQSASVPTMETGTIAMIHWKADANASPIYMIGGFHVVKDMDMTGTAQSGKIAVSEFAPNEAEFRQQYRQGVEERLARHGEYWQKIKESSNNSFDRASDFPRPRRQGKYVQSGESMSLRASDFQSVVTGLPPGIGYIENGVTFDGCLEGHGVLLEAKSRRYGAFVKNGKFRKNFKTLASFQKQVKNQWTAAHGDPIEWHFEEDASADIFRDEVLKLEYDNIEVISPSNTTYE